MDIHTPEAAFAFEVLHAAAALARMVQTELAAEGITKSDLSPVTVADFGIQALVARALEARFPGAALVGEETSEDLRKDSGRQALEATTAFVRRFAPEATPETVCGWIDRGGAAATGNHWTLDPIDGTKGYLRGGQYAIALGLIEEGRVRFGALSCPALAADCTAAVGTGATLLAERGAGAWRVEPGGTLTRLHVSSCADPHAARMLRSFEAGHTDEAHTEAFRRALGAEAPPVLMDSQAKYAVLASGGGELLVRFLSPKHPDYEEKIWDQAAGSIVLEEAGGRITDLAGNPLDFTQGRTLKRNRGIFASNGALHEAGLAALARLPR